MDPYVAVSGETFYADNDFNIKNYILDAIEGYYEQALDQTLTAPSPLAGFLAYTDSGLQSLYDTDSWMSVIRRNFDIIRNQLLNDSFVTTIDTRSGIVVPTKTYGTRNIPVGVTGRVQPADNIIGLASGAYGEIASIRENEAKIVKVYQRFRINGEVTGEALELGEVITSGGASGTIYAQYSDENNIYFDVAVTAGTFAVLILSLEQTIQVPLKSVPSKIDCKLSVDKGNSIKELNSKDSLPVQLQMLRKCVSQKLLY